MLALSILSLVIGKSTGGLSDFVLIGTQDWICAGGGTEMASCSSREDRCCAT